jgi:hypothetical protein
LGQLGPNRHRGEIACSMICFSKEGEWELIFQAAG